jgi:lipid A 3-O-deacylase
MLLTGLPTLVLADEVPTCAGKPGVKGLKPYPDVYNFYYENDLINCTDNNYTNGL